MASNEDWNLIFSYSRQQAIDDGVLIDVTEEAKRIGFKVQTVVTSNLFHRYLDPPAGLEGEGQSVTGRLHDLMVLALFAARRGVNRDRVTFNVAFLMAPGRKETIEAIVHIGPGDNRDPVLTIMLPEDD